MSCFWTWKTQNSLQRKIAASPEKYGKGKKLIQDAVGIRIVLYFPEDIQIIEELLRRRYKCDEGATTVDLPPSDVFSVTRHNLVFEVPSHLKSDMQLANTNNPIDEVFEIQVRSILSEGWHEVEHDLRYKRKDDWAGHTDLSRNLNGVVASLETAEWSMRKIFDDLAYRHYKNRQWEAMLHASLRMRISGNLSSIILEIINQDLEVAKGLLRINRQDLFRTLSRLAPKIPVTLDNMIYVWAFASSKNERLVKLIPDLLKEGLAS